MQSQSSVEPEGKDPEQSPIVGEEEQCLERVLGHLDGRKARESERPPIDYESQMLALRDEIAVARLEDVPPLVEQMERLQVLAAHQSTSTESYVDAKSPYFGRMVLEEGERRREVLIGRGTYLDTKSGVRIVDWRDAPVSRLYYRYDEGDEYDEVFGGREVNGEVVIRRSVSIVDRTLRRITAPQGTFARTAAGTWRRLGTDALKLHGGQGTAARADQLHRPGKLGIGGDELTEDKHLKEITALIDKRQFELITAPNSGLVVIQGGAGSGKTTIALHRLAYLNFQDPRRFRPDRMLIVVFNAALARYISQVLPALGVEGIPIRTYEAWAERVREIQLPSVPNRYSEDTPAVVTRLKKHPAMLKAIDEHVTKMAARFEARIEKALGQAKDTEGGAALLATFTRAPERPLAHRVFSVGAWLEKSGRSLPTDPRVALERLTREGVREARDVVAAWADLVSDEGAVTAAFRKWAPGELSEPELKRAHNWCAAHASQLVHHMELLAEGPHGGGGGDKPEKTGDEEHLEIRDAEEEQDFGRGVDGRELDEHVHLDREDDALLLRLCQRLRGPLMRNVKGKDALVYEHVLVDEAQDLSPVELAVVLDTVSSARSVTLAGDVAQRLLMDNGFSDWKTVLGELGLSHVAVEPLKLAYRSTQEIIDFAREALGPLAPEDAPRATRSGAPVDLFVFAHAGDAVGFLGEALRELMRLEPRASVAVVARYPEQADLYYDGLRKAEVPYLRRIADQDFPFRAGIDVTDVRQVKGLEFDYVILVEVSDAAYPKEEEARHLLHIGATRAAHQLWVVASGKPSSHLPESLRERGY
ncbi:MAG: DNA helicase UvrD [Sorangiineae bacterium PRO1]|nr:DNA helicase UvrD [Sorangiineae bacterium PRO1]